MGDFSLPDSIAGGSSHGPDNQSLMHQPEIRSAVTSQCCFYEYLGQSIGFGEHIQKTLVQPAPNFRYQYVSIKCSELWATPLKI